MQYSEVNDSARENMAAIARLRSDQSGSLVSTGDGGAYAIDTAVTYTSYSEDIRFSFKAHVISEPGPTIAVALSSPGVTVAKNLLERNGNVMVAGELRGNNTYTVVYDGTNFRVMEVGARIAPLRSGTGDRTVTGANFGGVMAHTGVEAVTYTLPVTSVSPPDGSIILVAAENAQITLQLAVSAGVTAVIKVFNGVSVSSVQSSVVRAGSVANLYRVSTTEWWRV